MIADAAFPQQALRADKDLPGLTSIELARRARDARRSARPSAAEVVRRYWSDAWTVQARLADRGIVTTSMSVSTLSGAQIRVEPHPALRSLFSSVEKTGHRQDGTGRTDRFSAVDSQHGVTVSWEEKWAG